ncbi:uncharacterized protein TNCV_2961921 [Trichonephila clavipes]|nr:uncharacterized protein TNCV_2961921 [Trichonephila clavipes]
MASPQEQALVVAQFNEFESATHLRHKFWTTYKQSSPSEAIGYPKRKKKLLVLRRNPSKARENPWKSRDKKIRLKNETQRVVGPQTLPQTKIELKKLLPTFNPEVDNMDLFLTLFERQMKLLDFGEDLWVPYLIGALSSDVTSLIAREPEEKCKDYFHIRGMLLQRFKLTAEKFRELFSRHRKIPNGT